MDFQQSNALICFDGQHIVDWIGENSHSVYFLLFYTGVWDEIGHQIRITKYRESIAVVIRDGVIIFSPSNESETFCSGGSHRTFLIGLISTTPRNKTSIGRVGIDKNSKSSRLITSYIVCGLADIEIRRRPICRCGGTVQSREIGRD